ncbi:MAG TPA: glycosyltransferase family 87 protein [Acidobacteriaceae bacterium]|nr:glycosyltransferase family 87 protein [Acidobacteriaceae bacterium]
MRTKLRRMNVGRVLQVSGAVLLLGACLAVLGAALSRNAAHRDFICYWSSARLLRAHANPYATQAILDIENAAGGGYREPFIMRNPPWALFLIAPLGFFSAPVAGFLWLVTLIGAALLSIRLLRNGAEKPPLVVYLFAPILGCANAGQTSIFLLLGIAFFFRYQERWPFWAGMALVLPAMKPHLFLLLWPVLLVHCWRTKQFRVLAGLAAGLGAAMGVALLFDPHVATHYLAAMRAEHIEGQYLPNIPCSLRALMPGHPVWVQGVPELLGVLLTARFYWRRRNQWNWRRDGAQLLAISLAVSPYSWPFDQLLYLPAVLDMCAARLARGMVPVLVLLNGMGLLLLLMTMPFSSPAYAWTGAACLLWFLWARRQAGLAWGMKMPNREMAAA